MSFLYDMCDDPPELLTATLNGPEEVSKLLIIEGVDVNVRDRMQNTALLVAAGNGNIECVKLLLDRGADIHHKNFFGETALHFASAKGHEVIVRLLLELGLDVLSLDNSRNTVLHAAAVGGNKNIASLFLSLGIGIHQKNGGLQTALHLAAKGGHSIFTDFLIEQGANVDELTRFGMTALLYACEKGDENVVKVLLGHGAEIGTKDNFNRSALYFAYESGNLNLIELLIDKGLGMGDKGHHHGASSLHFAAKRGDVRSVEKLLIYDLAIDVTDENGQSALHYASERGHERVVRLLLDNGAQITKDDFAWSVLHFAAKGGNENIVKIFLDRGLQVDNQDAEGNTALHTAVKNGNIRVIEALLLRGANINMSNNNKRSALSMSFTRDQVIKLLIRNGANRFEENLISTAVSLERSTAVKTLLNFGCVVNKGAFSLAIKANNWKIAEKILDNGTSEDFTRERHDILEGQHHKFNGLEILMDYELDLKLNFFEGIYYPEGVLNIALQWKHQTDETIRTTIIQMIISRLVRMKYQKLTIDESSWDAINTASPHLESTAHLSKCEEEIEMMKREKIGNSSVSFIDILITRNLQQLASFARNQDIVRAFESLEYKEKFPIYKTTLTTKIRRGKWRKVLLDHARDFFIAISSAECTDIQLPRLPATFIDAFCSHMSNKDLKMLIRACKSDFEMDIHDV